MFATAGGGGEAYDMCCFCPLFVCIVATLWAALAGLTSGAARASAVAVALATVAGMIVIPLVASMEPTTDPDEVGGQELQWRLFWMWMGAAAVALAGVVATVARAVRSSVAQATTAASVDESLSGVVVPGTHRGQEPHQRGSVTFRVRVGWLLALFLGLLLMSLLAGFKR